MSTPKMPKSKPPTGALFALALVLGLPIGGGAAWWLGGAGPAVAPGNSKSRSAPESAPLLTETKGEVSQLGRKPEEPQSAFSRYAKGLFETRRQQYAEAAAALSQEQRLDYILEIARQGAEDYFSADSEKMVDQSIKLRASILPQDIALLLPILNGSDLGLTPSQTHSLRQAVYAVAAEGEAKNVLATLPDTLDSETLQGVQAAILQKKAKDDPFGALEMMKQEEFAALGTSYYAQNLFSIAAAVDPARAFQMAQKTIGGYEGRKSAMASVLALMASKPGGLEKAVKLSQTIEAEGVRASAQGEFLQAYANGQPGNREEVLAYLKDTKELPASTRKSAVSSILQNWSWREPEQAFTWGLQHGQDYDLGEELKGTLSGILSQYAANAPAKALERVLALPPEQRLDYVGTTINILAKQDIPMAKAALEKLNPKELEVARPLLVAGWAERNPAEAAAYVSEVGAVPNREKLVTHVMEQWVQLDQRGASEWLAAQPADATRDGGIQSLVDVIQRQDPEAAALWAMQFTDNRKKNNAIDSTLSLWAKKDPEAARAFIQGQSANFTPEETAQKLKILEQESKAKK